MSSNATRILIADDDKFFRELLKVVIEAVGWDVAGEAGDGAEAVDLFQSLAPDMLWMDVNMPRMSGDEALRKIIAQHPEAVVIMLTGEDSTAEAKNYLAAGARVCLPKTTPAEIGQRVLETWNSYLAEAS